MPIYVLTKGLHFPYNIGEAIIIRNFVKVLADLYKDELSVISLIDPSRCYPFMPHEGVEYVQSLGNSHLDALQISTKFMRSVQGNTLPSTVHISGISHLIILSFLKYFAKYERFKFIPHFYMLQHAYVNKLWTALNNISKRLQSLIADAVVSTSPILARRLLTFGFMRVYYIEPPVDTFTFKPMEKHNSIEKLNAEFNLDLDENSFILLYLGHISPMRFPSYHVLKVLKKLLDNGISAHLLVFAPKFSYNEVYRAEILAKAGDLGISKHLNVFVTDLHEENKVIAYNSGDVFLFPALRPTAIDPPLTVLEAMACGKTVLASPIQSVPYLIKYGETGLLLDFMYTNKVYKLLRFVWKSPDVFKEIGANARQLIMRKFNVRNTMERLRRLNEEILEC